VCGVEAASNYYFSKTASELTLAESAFLGGINHAPNNYNPFVDEESKEKRMQLINNRIETVLDKMLETGAINQEEHEAAVAEVKQGIAFNKGQTISILEDGVQIGTTTTNTYEYTPTSSGTHTLHYFNTIDSSPLTVTVTGGRSIVSDNDTTTLNGALTELGEIIADNLITMGVTDVDANDGLTTLARKILDIEQSGSEQEIVSFDNLTTEFNYTRKRGSDGFSVTIPSGVTSLGVSCFNGCTGLTNVIIPSGVTNLGNYCFKDCISLTSVTIPNSVTSLGNYCFDACGGLTNVTIPSSATS
jgi:hypothetical protein